MLLHLRILLAGACAALTIVGCSTAATEDNQAKEPATSDPSIAVAADGGSETDNGPAPAVSEEKQTDAQQLAEEAEKIMLDPLLAPKQKYPKSLGMFRSALEIDPNNALAQKSIALIEDVYNSMGRPVPSPS